MKKRVLSLLMALTLCLTTLPTAVFADVTENGEGSGGTHYVAESGGTQYETVQDILDNMEEEITLLDSVTEGLTVYAPTTIHMNGHSITGNIDATDSLTLNGGTVDGTVTVNATGGTFTMTAPAEAEAAITGGLSVVSGSASVSGAKVGVKGTLYFDGTDMLISGAVKAVELDSAAKPAAKTLYGSATVNGDTAAEAGFDTDTYKVGGEIAKKLTNKQVGSTTPAAPSLTLTETSKSLTAGKTAVFTANYTGTDTLNAYVQGSAVNGYFTISQKNNGDGTYTIKINVANLGNSAARTLDVVYVNGTPKEYSLAVPSNYTVADGKPVDLKSAVLTHDDAEGVYTIYLSAKAGVTTLAGMADADIVVTMPDAFANDNSLHGFSGDETNAKISIKYAGDTYSQATVNGTKSIALGGNAKLSFADGKADVDFTVFSIKKYSGALKGHYEGNVTRL